jgi:hypothetical protein
MPLALQLCLTETMTKSWSMAMSGKQRSTSLGMPQSNDGVRSAGVSPVLFPRAISRRLPAGQKSMRAWGGPHAAISRFLIVNRRLETAVTCRKQTMATRSNRHSNEG